MKSSGKKEIDCPFKSAFTSPFETKFRNKLTFCPVLLVVNTLKISEMIQAATIITTCHKAAKQASAVRLFGKISR